MNKEQAIDILKKVCAEFKGTLSEHQAVQAALKLIHDELKEKPAQGV